MCVHHIRRLRSQRARRVWQCIRMINSCGCVYDCELDCVSNIFVCYTCDQEPTQQDGEEPMRSIPLKINKRQG